MEICSEGSIYKSIQNTLVLKPTLSKGKQKDGEKDNIKSLSYNNGQKT